MKNETNCSNNWCTDSLLFDCCLYFKLSNNKRFEAVRSEDEGSNPSSHIVYSRFHGDTSVESLTVTGPHDELELSPYIIESKISVDVALLTLLHDAYLESTDGSKQVKWPLNVT